MTREEIAIKAGVHLIFALQCGVVYWWLAPKLGLPPLLWWEASIGFLTLRAVYKVVKP